MSDYDRSLLPRERKGLLVSRALPDRVSEAGGGRLLGGLRGDQETPETAHNPVAVGLPSPQTEQRGACPFML